MRTLLSALLITTLVLPGCGSVRDSRLNPKNWFGKSQVVEVDENAEVNPLIPRKKGLASRKNGPAPKGALIEQVSALTIERVPGGAVIRAQGIAAHMGGYDLRLVPLNDGKPEKGMLSYEMRLFYPVIDHRRSRITGTARARTLNVAHHLTDQDLDGVRSIRVIGDQNSRSSKRR